MRRGYDRVEGSIGRSYDVGVMNNIKYRCSRAKSVLSLLSILSNYFIKFELWLSVRSSRVASWILEVLLGDVFPLWTVVFLLVFV